MDALAELRTLVGRYGTPKGFTPEGLGVRFTSSTTLLEPVCSVEGPAFAMLLQGSKRTLVGEKSYNYSAGECLVISLELPITATVTRASRTEPFLSFGMLLRPAEIASLLLEGGEAGIATAVPESGVGLSRTTPELVDAVLRLVRLVERPGDVRVLRPMIEREILWRLLQGPQASLVRQIGLADSRLSQVSRAVSWIRSNFNKALRVDDLAGLSGMSVSSFHRNFRAVTAMSPLQYQKQIRLQEARARLIADARDIAAVGFAVGYESPSQFSREYRRQFGEAPGRDAARLVEMAAG